MFFVLCNVNICQDLYMVNSLITSSYFLLAGSDRFIYLCLKNKCYTIMVKICRKCIFLTWVSVVVSLLTDLLCLCSSLFLTQQPDSSKTDHAWHPTQSSLDPFFIQSKSQILTVAPKPYIIYTFCLHTYLSYYPTPY